MFSVSSGYGKFLAGSLMLLLFFVLLFAVISHDGPSAITEKNRHPSEVSAAGPAGTILQGSVVDLLIKSWIPNKDKFEILSIAKSQYSENYKTEIRLSLSEAVRWRQDQCRYQFIYSGLIHDERDEIPVLS